MKKQKQTLQALGDSIKGTPQAQKSQTDTQKGRNDQNHDIRY